ncbi:hypothetical protein FRC03_003188 [Tulasnella sp. 419]|nr:hypothetical protein FRC03_003188 [Tulasnella sp. 419]
MERDRRRQSCLCVILWILACLGITLIYSALFKRLNHVAPTKALQVIGLVLCSGVIIWQSIKIASNLTAQRLARTSSTTPPSNVSRLPDNCLIQTSQAVDNLSKLRAEDIPTHLDAIYTIPNDSESQLQENCDSSTSGADVHYAGNVYTLQQILLCVDPSSCPYVQASISGMREEITDVDSMINRKSVCACMQHLDKTGKIERKGKIYSGACSDVYKGTLLSNHGVTSTPVALKTIRIRTRPGMTHDDTRYHRRFTKMLRLSFLLNHPNITPLLGFSIASDMDDLPNLIFPWYSSGNVVQYLNHHPTASRPHLLQDALKGLEYIHSLSLVHGDIKAENILVNDAGFACLADFGISSFIQANNSSSADNQTSTLLPSSSCTSSSVSGGTLPFLSPEELLKGGRKQMPSDIWKVGCTAVQIMAGKIPYEGITIHCDLVLKITRGIPPMDVEHYAASPEERYLWDSIVRCWNLDAESRPSAVTLRAQIDNTIENYFPDRKPPQ